MVYTLVSFVSLPEVCLVDVNGVAQLQGLGLAETNGADLRPREDGGRDQLVIRRRGHAAEERSGKTRRLMDGDRCQVEAAGDIADGVNIGNGTARVRIHHNIPGRVQRHASGFQSQALGVG